MKHVPTLIHQLVHHGVPHEEILKKMLKQGLSDCTIATDLSQRISLQTLIQCFDANITFASDSRIISYDTIEKIPYDKNVTDDQLAKFTALTSIDLRNTKDVKLNFLTNKRQSSSSTDLHNTKNAKLNLPKSSNPYHSLCRTLREINVRSSNVKISNVKYCRNLESLILSDTVDNCDFFRRLRSLKKLNVGAYNMHILDELSDHESICNNLVEFVADETHCESSSLLKFQRLQKIDLGVCEYFELDLPADHPLCDTVTCFLSGLMPMENQTRKNGIINFRKLSSLELFGDISPILSYLNDSHPWCESLEKLNMTRFRNFDDSQFCKIALLRNLRSLKLESCGMGSSIDDFSFLRENQLCNTLEELIVNETNIKDTDLQILVNLQKLSIINEEKVTLDFLSKIPSDSPILSSLISLEIVNSRNISDSALQRLCNLQRLAITNNNLELNFLTDSHPWCQTLLSLEVENSEIDNRIQHLHNLQKLTMINTECDFDFITISHPWCRSLVSMKIRPCLDSTLLSLFQNLKID